jgi:putative oxidoreductase
MHSVPHSKSNQGAAMEARRQDLMTSLGLLILRLGIGGFLVIHGWDKVQMILAGDFDKFGNPIGLGSAVSLVLTALAEFICALLVMVGFATRLAAMPVVFAMAVAAFKVHAGDPWTMGGAGASKEPAFLYLTPFLALIFTGAGWFSVDGLIWPRWRARRARQKAQT